MPKSVQGIPDNYPMVTVRYEGAAAKHNITGLATKIRYGRKKNGDIFQMHRDDVQANRELFTVLAEPSATASTLPKTPAEIRVPEPELRPSIVEVPPLGDGPVGTSPDSSFVETETSVKSKAKPKTTRRKTTTRKRAKRTTKAKVAKKE